MTSHDLMARASIDAGTLAEIRQSGWDLFIDKAKKRYKLPRGVVEFLARKFVTI